MSDSISKCEELEKLKEANRRDFTNSSKEEFEAWAKGWIIRWCNGDIHIEFNSWESKRFFLDKEYSEWCYKGIWFRIEKVETLDPVVERREAMSDSISKCEELEKLKEASSRDFSNSSKEEFEAWAEGWIIRLNGVTSRIEFKSWSSKSAFYDKGDNEWWYDKVWIRIEKVEKLKKASTRDFTNSSKEEFEAWAEGWIIQWRGSKVSITFRSWMSASRFVDKEGISWSYEGVWIRKEKVEPSDPIAERRASSLSDITSTELVDSYKNNSVESPSHYTKHPSGIECIDVVQHMNYNCGNVVKYIWRADLKHDSALQDLLKAQQYIAFEIARVTKELEDE